MSEGSARSSPDWDDATWSLVNEAIGRLEAAWRNHQPPRLGDFLPVPCEDQRFAEMLFRLVEVDQECRARAGLRKAFLEYLAEWPQLQGRPGSPHTLVPTISDHPASAKAAARSALPASDGNPETPVPSRPVVPWVLRILCPHCHRPVEIIDEDALVEISCPACGSSFSLMGGGRRLNHPRVAALD